MTTRAPITPSVLAWARERAGLSVKGLAERMGVPESRVEEWESGQTQPTLHQAEKLARVLRIPLGYFFLSQPPQILSPVADFRALPQNKRGLFSPELIETLHDALRKRDWLREWRQESGFMPLPFIRRFHPEESSPEQIAEDIRQELSLPSPSGVKQRSWSEHLRLLVRQAEARGILVLQSSIVKGSSHRKLSVEEFRGFSLADEYAPVIFINTQDSVAARIFTFAHELGHLWTGTSGVSNPLVESEARDLEIERFCNRVAAQLLMPREAFLRLWQEKGALQPEERIQHLAEALRVSALAVLVRARELDCLDMVEFQTYKEHILKAQQETALEEEPQEGTPNFYNTWRVRNGRLLVDEIFQALRQGAVPYREAAMLLNVRLDTLQEAMQRF